jgi:hypothetical protein
VPGTGFTFTASSQQAAHRLLYKDAEGDQQMMNIFAALLLGAAASAAFNLVSRTVEAQRREIGIGDGARRETASARAATTAARRPGGGPRDPGWIRGERVVALGDADILPPAHAQT